MNHVAMSLLLTSCGSAAIAQSNIDSLNKLAWAENVGWTNWHDADGASAGVVVGDSFMAGHIWTENGGWISVGDGAPASTCATRPCYANATDADFGVNIDPDGTLHGYGWSENIGWINFDGGAMATPPQAARIACAGPPAQNLARLTGLAWGENVGWINLATPPPGQFVAVTAAGTPLACDMNHDGAVNGRDIQLFVNSLLDGAGLNWRDVCSGDVQSMPDHTIDPADTMAFVACLLG